MACQAQVRTLLMSSSPTSRPDAGPNSPARSRDVLIVGGGIGGVITLKYAADAGLDALLLEGAGRVGGLWRDLPSWQDIQFRKEDWALGDLPISDEHQPSILENIESWVERFDLAPRIRLGARVRRASPEGTGWRVTTDTTPYDARWLIVATGAHNRPVVPPTERVQATVREYHSSELDDPERLRGRRVTVVGGGASAYDLLDLCFIHGASRVAWVYRSAKWMRPTLQRKYYGTDVRFLARSQLFGTTVEELNQRINEDLQRRYRKAGIEDIMPAAPLDLRREQLIPGRREMIANFHRIDRHRGEVTRIAQDQVRVSDGAGVDTDVLLWGTGYDMDLGYLDVEGLNQAPRPRELMRRCFSGFRSCDAPNLFFLAPGVLETTTSTPWAYAHVARSMMAHIRGRPIFEDPPSPDFTNHFDLVKQLARRDRDNFRPGIWRIPYLRQALLHPSSKPMPIP